MPQSYSKYVNLYKAQFQRPHSYKWADLKLAQMMDVGVKDLKLSLNKSNLVSKAIAQVLKEWGKLGYRWKPYFWFSTEWFYPEGTYGVAIPFYLAHPKLMALEKYLMANVEGKNLEDIKKYLRHELGHLLDYGYRWRFDRERREVFGLSSIRYPSMYHVEPTSKKYVKNLPAHYAQSHPDEDFAETFAYYLKHRTTWKKRHPSGIIHRKIAIIDRLIKDTRKAKPSHLEKFKVGDINNYRMSLERFYLKRSYERGISQKEILSKLHGKGESASNKDLRDYIGKVLKDLDLPSSYKQFLSHKYYSPLIHNKKVISLWSKRDLKNLRAFIKEKPLKWLKKGPYYYT